MIGFAAHRTQDRRLVLISPKDGVEFEIEEDVLNVHMIELGDFCSFKVEKNLPVAFAKEVKGMKGMNVEVDKNDALVLGVKGELIERGALFYKTEIFGDVACKDEDSGNNRVGKKCDIIVSRLSDAERVGMYSKCVWKGVRSVPKLPLEKLKIDDSKSEADEEEGVCRKIVGLVVGFNPSKNRAYVASNLTYPGADGVVQCSHYNKRQVGDWLEIRFTKADHEKYFPPTPTESTPRFYSTRHKNIQSPGNYVVKVVNKSPEIVICGLKLSVSHRTGRNIAEPRLGQILDSNALTPNGPTAVDVLIARKVGKPTMWYVKDVRGQQAPPMNAAFPPPPYGFFPVPTFFAPMPPPPASGRPGTSAKICGVGFQTADVDVKLEFKRALVTSSKKSEKHNNMMVFLWLIDDHTSSIFYVSNEDQLHPGHFFEGKFSRNKSKWMCEKYVRPLGKLAEGSLIKDAIELHIDVEKLFPEGGERRWPETWHELTGKILDKFSILTDKVGSVNRKDPTIAAIKIGVRLWNIEETKQWAWVVSRLVKTKSSMLLTEFRKAWNTAGVRDLVRETCPREFLALRDLMDEEETTAATAPGTFPWTNFRDGDFVRMTVFPRRIGQKFSAMKQNVEGSAVFQDVRKMEANKLYKVELDKNGKVTKMSDCVQTFSANKNGEFKFEFRSTDEDPTFSLVEPVGLPGWVGKLMLTQNDRNSLVSHKRMIWKGNFRLLNESDPLADNYSAATHGVCFESRGGLEKDQTHISKNI